MGHSAANRLFGSLRCEILSQKRAHRIAHPTIFLRGYRRGAGALCSSAGPSSRATGGSWYDLRMVRRPGRGVVWYVSSRPKPLEKVVAVRMPRRFPRGAVGVHGFGTYWRGIAYASHDLQIPRGDSKEKSAVGRAGRSHVGV